MNGGVNPRSTAHLQGREDSRSRGRRASRSPDGRYRTTPLRGLWAHHARGFYHDGRFATLRDVVDHYDATFGLGLTDADEGALVEYLKSL